MPSPTQHLKLDVCYTFLLKTTFHTVLKLTVHTFCNTGYTLSSKLMYAVVVLWNGIELS